MLQQASGALREANAIVTQLKQQLTAAQEQEAKGERGALVRSPGNPLYIPFIQQDLTGILALPPLALTSDLVAMADLYPRKLSLRYCTYRVAPYSCCILGLLHVRECR